MVNVNPAQLSFNAGEFAPELEGRTDFDKYANSCKKLENFLPQTQGPLLKRSGTRFIKEVDASANKSRLVSFEFNTDQAYIVEFADQMLRFYRNSGTILHGSSTAITGISNASPAVVTAVAHGLSTGDEVFIDTASDMLEVNARYFTITRVTANSFSLDGEDSLLYSTWTAGGTIDKVYKLGVRNQASTSAITNASPGAVTTSTPHGFATGDVIRFENVLGMVGINNATYTITVTSTTAFTIGVDSSAFGTYTSGGICGYVIPYTSAQLEALAVAQSADTLYIASPDQPPAKLTRTGHTAWTLDEIDWEWAPFSPENLDQESTIVSSGRNVDDSVTLVSRKGEFTSAMVGALVKLREVVETQHQEWIAEDDYNAKMETYFPATNIRSAKLNSSDGDEVFYEGNVYELISEVYVGTCGLSPPIHDEGDQTDGAWMWSFSHPGFGYAKITAFTNAHRVTATVVKRLPRSVTDQFKTGTTATVAGATITFTATNHGLMIGDKIWCYGFTEMTDINDVELTVATVTTSTFTVVEDGTGFTNETTGGTVVYVKFGEDETYVVNVALKTHQAPNLLPQFDLWSLGAFSADRGYPRAVSFFEDRLAWAGTSSDPQTVWMSRTGDYENHKEDSLDTSALLFTLNTDKVNLIEWLNATTVLQIGTAGGEFTMGAAAAANALTPGNVRVKRNSTYGSKSKHQPQPVGQALLFVQRAGRKVRELIFDFDTDSFFAPDLTLLAPHIALDKIQKIVYQQEPTSQLWAMLEDGELVCLTYERPHDVVGWHHHPLGGTSAKVESIAVIPHEDGDRDQLWMIVSRTINGGTKRYIEILEQDWLRSNDLDDAFFVDSGLTYDSSAATTIYGLNHLEGETVKVFGDSLVQSDQVVSSGQITITSASTVQVGLNYDAIYQAMRFEFGSRTGTTQGKITRITRGVLRIDQTGQGLLYGGSDTTAKMEEVKIPAGTLYDGDTEDFAWPEGYQRDEQGARFTVKHNKPTPCMITAVLPQLETYDR